MMSVSENIANLNYDRYQNWLTPFTTKNSKQALLTFIGDVYRDIDSENYTKEDFAFAQECLRTISGLYGLLRPLDLIQPYRLEMKFRYKYWKAILTEHLQDYKDPIINLASKEYSSAIDLKKLQADVYNIVFKEKKPAGYKTIPLYSKIARGTMANWIVMQRITEPQKLQAFKEDDYKFAPELSTKQEFVFTRG